MALYSKENVDEAYQQSLVALASTKSSSPSPSVGKTETYRLLHSEDNLTPKHSVRYEEPREDDYPHYQGFVDPNLQSPSFRRLQYLTGVTPDKEHVEIQSGNVVKVHTNDAPYPKQFETPTQTGQSTGTQYTRPEESKQYTDQSRAAQPPPPPPPLPLVHGAQRIVASGNVQNEQQSSEHTAVFGYEPNESDEKQQINEELARKLAEAEKPKVPPSAAPFWAKTAQEKHAKWEDRQDAYQTQHRTMSPSVAATPIRNADYHNYRHHTEKSRFTSSAPLTRTLSYTMPRSTSSQQVGGYRTLSKPRSSGSESWLKVCMAPNVDQIDRPYTPNLRYPQRETSQVTYTSKGPMYRASEAMPRKQVNISSLVSGEAERPIQQPITLPPWHQTAEYKHSKWQQQLHQLDPNNQPKAVPADATPSWARRAEEKQYSWQRQGETMDPSWNRPPPRSTDPPSWAKRAEKTQQLWRHEAEAWNQRQQQQQQQVNAPSSQTRPPPPPPSSTYISTSRISSANTQYSQPTVTDQRPPWRQKTVPHESITQGMYALKDGQQTTAVSLGTAKSVSTGSFYDEHGNKVDFEKELYSSVDPGKEYSLHMEKEETKFEKPVEPGMLSRKTVQRYYKKTYTSTTTTKSNVAAPLTTSAQMPSSVYTRTTEMPKLGPISANESQF
ncbi:Transcription factor BTF3 4 [Trichuris trichiura]|uniref:Transcription factor BTF3 4 n=1 Tax=Trichuris trichiura TaxID=36087 RepID=A0A077Z286_TRITR|nr:Transcription factor BTF3 4 [Trichuris trichiura]